MRLLSGFFKVALVKITKVILCFSVIFSFFEFIKIITKVVIAFSSPIAVSTGFHIVKSSLRSFHELLGALQPFTAHMEAISRFEDHGLSLAPESPACLVDVRLTGRLLYRLCKIRQCVTGTPAMGAKHW
jgi:hypothetical protein